MQPSCGHIMSINSSALGCMAVGSYVDSLTVKCIYRVKPYELGGQGSRPCVPTSGPMHAS